MLIAATVWLAGNLAARGPGWLASADSREGSPVMAQFDPKLGTPVAGAGPAGERRLFVHVGSCSGCSAFQLDPAKTDTPGGASVTVVYSGKECAPPEHLANLPSGWRSACDPQGEVQAALNLYFAPRWYEVDKEGRLTWIGKDGDDLPQGVKVEG